MTEDALLDFIEENSAKIKESVELNILKWDNTVSENRMPWGGNGGNWGRGGNGMGMKKKKKGEDYETSVEVVKEYVKNRFESLSNLINKAYSSANEE